jgi:uncharacterized delta-60 repeat protein
VIRLRPGGARDPAFGGDGVVFTDFGRRLERANAVALQPDGRIVAGGSVSDGTRESWSFARYLSGGGLDTSFGGDGRVTMSLSISGEQVQDVVVRSERIIAAGYAESNFLPEFAVGKLRLGGGRVTSFGRNGVKRIRARGPGGRKTRPRRVREPRRAC